MDNFETALNSIVERVKAYDSKLAGIKNALKKRFEECKAHREQIIKDLTIITNREGDMVGFTDKETGGRDSYRIERMPWGFVITISDHGYDCKHLPSGWIDGVKDLSSAESKYEDLIDIDKNNQRFDDLLKAYLRSAGLRADIMKDRFEKILRECWQ